MSFEVPRSLPVDHLSHSSIRTYLRCPERWHRRYIQMEYEPTNPNMMIGKCVGSGVSAGYLAKLAEGDMGEAMLSVTSDTFDDIVEHEEIDWQEEAPGPTKDKAIACVGAYHDKIAVQFEPLTVEEGFEIAYPDADWKVTGYIDFTGGALGIDADLHDLKVVAKANNAIDEDVQATLYVASRYVRDGSLPSFAWHQVKKPTARNGPEVSLITTTRSPLQVNNYLGRVAQVAREIDWRTQTGNWQGATPGSWWCSQKFCGYYDTCPYGGQK